jgi:hypothetical protein
MQEVWLLVDYDNIDNWNIDNFQLLNSMKLNGISIHLVFRGHPMQLSLEHKLTLIQTRVWAQLNYIDSFSVGNLQQIARVKLVNNQLYDYFTNDFHAQLDADWGNSRCRLPIFSTV